MDGNSLKDGNGWEGGKWVRDGRKGRLVWIGRGRIGRSGGFHEGIRGVLSRVSLEIKGKDL